MRAVIIISRFNLRLINQLIDQNNVQIVAIVTDDRIYVREHCDTEEIVFGLWQLAEVVQKTSPDYVINLMPIEIYDFCREELKKIEYPVSRLCMLLDYALPITAELKMRFNLLEHNPNAYKIFLTGNSCPMHSIDAKSFDLPLIGFAFSSQDLYYDYKIAERIVKISAPPPPELAIF